jgi:hypothetical protein
MHKLMCECVYMYIYMLLYTYIYMYKCLYLYLQIGSFSRDIRSLLALKCRSLDMSRMQQTTLNLMSSLRWASDNDNLCMHVFVYIFVFDIDVFDIEHANIYKLTYA